MRAVYEKAVVCCILVYFLVLTATGCDSGFPPDYHLDEQSFDAKYLKMVEQYTSLTLPAGSRGLRMFCKAHAIDPSFYAKIEIPSAAHEALAEQLKQIPHDIDFHSGGDGLTRGIAWWPPAKETIKAKRMYSPAGHVRAFLCQEGDRWVLYVQWWTV